MSARVLKDRKAVSLEVRREAKEHFDSTGVWRARLLNQEIETAGSTAAVPDLPKLDVSSIAPGNTGQQSLALEYLHQEIGKIAFAATLIPELIPVRRALETAIDELVFFREVNERLQKKVVVETNFHKKADWEGKLHQAKGELQNVERFARHCRVVLGRECEERQFSPPGTQKYFDQIKKIK